MKKLYHLFVTSYKLQRLHRFLLSAFCFLFSSFSALAQMVEATVTDVVFSCPGIVVVTYDLALCGPIGSTVNITFSYSPDKCTWNPAPGATGAVGLQGSGNNKKITWNAAAYSAAFGKLYFKVEYPANPNPNPVPVLINGVKWCPVNLNFGGWFCENPWDYGGLYQWGRVADGHECREITTLTTNTLSPTDQPGHSRFILAPDDPFDWLESPDDFHLNSDENNPIKTANDPCPDGWRVPTRTELASLGVPVTNQTLVTKVWTTQNGINGFLCTDNSSGNSLFLPAAGYRYCTNGTRNYIGVRGYYWSSTPASAKAYGIGFLSAPLFDVGSDNNRAYGFSVRCVSEN